MPTENRTSNTEQMAPAAPGALAESIANVEAWLADSSDPGSVSIVQRESIDLVLYELKRLRLPSIEQRPEDAQSLTEQHAAFIGLDEDLMMSQAADFQDAAYALGFSRGRSLLAAQHPEYLSLGGQLARAATQLINAMDDETVAWTETMTLKQALENWAMGKPADQHQVLPELTDDLREILGRPNFTCHHIAKALRVMGHTIKPKSEDEQAVVIHWLLGHYLKHGVDWRQHASAEFEVASKSLKA